MGTKKQDASRQQKDNALAFVTLAKPIAFAYSAKITFFSAKNSVFVTDYSWLALVTSLLSKEDNLSLKPSYVTMGSAASG